MSSIKANKSFEEIKHIDDNGVEFWLARELQVVLQYKEWRNFSKVIDTAKIACIISQIAVEHCFVEVNKPIISGKGKTENIKDYRLSRYACYLIVMNGDPRSESLFAIKCRKSAQQCRNNYPCLKKA